MSSLARQRKLLGVWRLNSLLVRWSTARQRCELVESEKLWALLCRTLFVDRCHKQCDLAWEWASVLCRQSWGAFNKNRNKTKCGSFQGIKRQTGKISFKHNSTERLRWSVYQNTPLPSQKEIPQVINFDDMWKKHQRFPSTFETLKIYTMLWLYLLWLLRAPCRHVSV